MLRRGERLPFGQGCQAPAEVKGMSIVTIHDPTTLNRQGPDVGTQYRSVVFYRSPEQKATVEQVIEAIQVAKLWNAPIVTEIAPFKAFYKAEDYHQEYFKLNGEQPYCRAVIAPKMAKFRKEYKDKLKGR